MHLYSTETFLPCNIPEIHYLSTRRKFANVELDQEISLTKMSAVPFLKGALLLFNDSAFFIDDFEALLDIDSQHITLSEHIKAHPDSLSELEELNAIGAIVFGNHKRQLQYSQIAYNCKTQYRGANWSNFSLTPIVLELDITNACNSSCIHCSRSSTQSSGLLDFNTILQIFSQCTKYCVSELLIMGGEPLLHPQFIDILFAAKDSGLKAIRTSTNGILVSPEIGKYLAKLTDHVQVSIHGSSIKTHDTITRTRGSFLKACQAVEILRSEGIDTAVSFTVMEHNVDDITSMPELALKLGANSLRFLALSNVGRAHCLNPMTTHQRDIIGLKIQAIHDEYSHTGLHISAGGFPALAPISNTATLYGCAAARTHLHVAYDSGVNPCGSIEGYEVCSLEATDLLDAWHDDRLKILRHQSNCDCSFKFVCSGPCKADLIMPSVGSGITTSHIK